MPRRPAAARTPGRDLAGRDSHAHLDGHLDLQGGGPVESVRRRHRSGRSRQATTGRAPRRSVRRTASGLRPPRPEPFAVEDVPPAHARAGSVPVSPQNRRAGTKETTPGRTEGRGDHAGADGGPRRGREPARAEEAHGRGDARARGDRRAEGQSAGPEHDSPDAHRGPRATRRPSWRPVPRHQYTEAAAGRQPRGGARAHEPAGAAGRSPCAPVVAARLLPRIAHR